MPVDVDGVPGEWSIASGSDASRILMFFREGGYCSGSIFSHCGGALTLQSSRLRRSVARP
jgi:hypothetical protein